VTGPDVRRHPDRASLAAAMADDVAALLAELTPSSGGARVVLTGGTVARDLHRALATRADRVDWSRVTVLWGDERFVPLGDDDRNDGQGTEDLLAHVPVGTVHRMPSPDDGLDLEAGAATYARVVEDLLAERDAPALDLVMLGIGPDGHVASLFPGHDHPDALVVAEPDSPKPPPARISLSMPLICRASRVWFVASGEEKADAVRGSVLDDPPALPAGLARGLDETRWYLDEAAASRL
jgi:6-phosphogluconolactonase